MLIPTAHQGRAQVLFDQSRYDLAAQELQQEIASNPDNSRAFSLLALCRLFLNSHMEALKYARHAIHLSPDRPYAHYVIAFIHDHQKSYVQAESSVLQAIKLNPENAEYFGLLSQIRVHAQNWKGAFHAADNGLKINALNGACGGFRAFALVKLGRQDEANEQIVRSLAKDPESNFIHAAQGWILLESGNSKQALVHFQESLRLNPHSEWARIGMIVSLKARNPLYRLILIYSFWRKWPSDRTHAMGILVRFFLFGVVIASTQFLGLEVGGAMFLSTIFLIEMSFIAGPFSSTLLVFDRLGRSVLTKQELKSARCLALSVLVSASTAVGFWITRWVGLVALMGGFLIVNLLVALAYGAKDKSLHKQLMIIAAVVAASAIGIAALAGSTPF